MVGDWLTYGLDRFGQSVAPRMQSYLGPVAKDAQATVGALAERLLPNRPRAAPAQQGWSPADVAQRYGGVHEGDGDHGPILSGFPAWPDAVRALWSVRSGEIRGGLSHPAVDGPIDVPFGMYNPDQMAGYGLIKQMLKPDHLVDDLPERLAGMSEVMSNTPNRIRLRNPQTGEIAVVSRNWKGEDKNWLLNAYRPGVLTGRKPK